MRELLQEAAKIQARAHDHLMELSAKLPMQYFGLVDSGIIQDLGNLMGRIDAALAEPERGGIDKTTVSLCLPKADDPFYRAECKVIDIGYADNRLVVECPELQKPGAAPEPDAMEIVDKLEKLLNMDQAVFPPPSSYTEAAALIADYGRRVPQWISVKERLPEDDDPIVVTNNIKSWKGHSWLVRGIRLDPNKPDIKDGEYCAWDSFNKIWGVTHWMPLPEPPVGKEGEK